MVYRMAKEVNVFVFLRPKGVGEPCIDFRVDFATSTLLVISHIHLDKLALPYLFVTMIGVMLRGSFEVVTSVPERWKFR